MLPLVRKFLQGSGTERVRITPEIAEEILKLNTGNREIRSVHLKTLKRQMAEGRWVFQGGTIVISVSGRLVDGQHRLMAVCATGVSIEVIVVWGVPDEVADTLDTGSARNGSDVFFRHGVHQSNIAAATVRQLISMSRNFVNKKKESPAELYEYFRANPGISVSVDAATRHPKCTAVEASTLAVVHYVASRFWPTPADRYIHGFRTLEGLRPNSPISSLHGRLSEERRSKGRVHTEFKIAWLIKGFNKFLRGEPAGTIRYTRDEVFPRILTPDEVGDSLDPSFVVKKVV